MKKTIALLLAAILLLSLAACGQTAQPAEPAATEVPAEAPAEVESSAEPDNSNVDYSLRVAQMGTSIKAAMVVLANEMGYYAEEGLDVTFEPINNLNDGITAILGGSLDILPFGVIPTCTFVAQGADLTVTGGTIAEGSECVMTPEKCRDLHRRRFDLVCRQDRRLRPSGDRPYDHDAEDRAGRC